jgi:hypothetical protein
VVQCLAGMQRLRDLWPWQGLGPLLKTNIQVLAGIVILEIFA